MSTTQSNQELRLPIHRYLLFLVPMLAVSVSDLLTKHYVFAAHFPAENPLWGHEPVWWIDGVFGIQTSTNPGALFGLGSGYSWLFAALSVIIFFVVLGWLFLFGGARDRWLTLAFGLIGGGIIGNFYDRVGLGYVPGRPAEIRYNVRDWILFRLEGVPFFDPWPNFNLADAGLVVGAVMLFVHAFFADPRQMQSPDRSNAQE